jgi:hypothetical protein
MAAKLNQIIAIRKGVVSQWGKWETAMYHLIQKEALFNGLTRVYQPRADDGEQLPPESTKVQAKVEGPDGVFAQLRDALARMWDVTLTQDTANAEAKADVKVGSVVVLPQVPVTFLLGFEKQLVDLRTILSKMPLLDPAQDWTWDPKRDLYVAEVKKTTRGRKVPKAFVKAAATDKHPAQVEVFYEDQVVGDWSLTNLSGALPASRQRELLGRVEELLKAVKFAREEANSVAVTDQEAAGPVFAWLFRD